MATKSAECTIAVFGIPDLAETAPLWDIGLFKGGVATGRSSAPLHVIRRRSAMPPTEIDVDPSFKDPAWSIYWPLVSPSRVFAEALKGLDDKIMHMGNSES